jgi:hypothetical protein
MSAAAVFCGWEGRPAGAANRAGVAPDRSLLVPTTGTIYRIAEVG